MTYRISWKDNLVFEGTTPVLPETSIRSK